MKTEQKILDLFVETFKESSDRATLPGAGCQYYTPDGRMCAVGILMIEPHKYSGSIENVLHDYGKEILRPEFRGVSGHFLAEVQGLHDSASYWDEHGLNRLGRNLLANLRDKYAE